MLDFAGMSTMSPTSVAFPTLLCGHHEQIGNVLQGRRNSHGLQRMVGQRVFSPWITLSLPVGNIARILPPSVITVGQDEWCHSGSVDDRRHGRMASGYPL